MRKVLISIDEKNYKKITAVSSLYGGNRSKLIREIINQYFETRKGSLLEAMKKNIEMLES